MKKRQLLKSIWIVILSFVLIINLKVNIFAASSGHSTTDGNAISGDDPTDTSSGSTSGLLVDGDDDDLDSSSDTEGQNDIAVNAKIIKPGEYYSVTVQWGNMQFVFDRSGTWNPDTHEYVRTEDENWDIDGYVDAVNNKITVTNNSNANVDVKAEYSHTYSNSSTYFNADPTQQNAVYGYLFSTNEAARTCATITDSNAYNYSNVDSIDATWQTLDWYSSDDEEQTGTYETQYYFTFCGSPDETVSMEDWTKVGVITLTVTPYNETHFTD